MNKIILLFGLIGLCIFSLATILTMLIVVFYNELFI